MFFKIEFNQLPFEPAKQQVIYVENEYNETINRFIQTNYEAIRKHYEFWGWEFCYMPYLAKDLTSTGAADYYAPYSEGAAECDFKSDFLLGFMANPQNISKVPPSLVYYSDAFAEKDACIFRGISLDGEHYFEDKNLSVILEEIIDDISNNSPYSGIMFRMASGDDIYDDLDDYVKAEIPDEETRDLLKELEWRISDLKQRGVSAYVLERLINKPEKLSRLVITSDYRILLPDYNNMEIQMTPLVKAVYLLFLRHPEGIIFKHLMDYRDELKDIYKKIKGDRWIISQRRSIEDVTDPMKNSINEKCARVREAFVTRFDERLAHHYIITGERGEPKRITLPQELIEWE
jgi:hypothetical protein